MNNLKLKLYNTITDSKEVFTPLDIENIRMYVCGPTVYSRPHIGNARSYVIYDILFRTLRYIYPNVTYVRNITDVDDKILNQAKLLNISPQEIVNQVTQEFHEDTQALYCLQPTFEPKATENIEEMLEIIDVLIEKGYAYQNEGHVLFSVDKFPDYGCLSRKNIEDLVGGARIEVESYKKSDRDFVLWKPADKAAKEYGFESKFGYGRPGWHIECSAMSRKYLGDEFDIHGGGADLKFPHHDNEIAQSVCASGKNFAKYWVHNGFLMVNGEKMSKSLGNFTTPRDLINKGHHPEVIRLALLSNSYSKPLDFTEKLLNDCKIVLEKFYTILSHVENLQETNVFDKAIEAILDDINTPRYLATMHYLTSDIKHSGSKADKEDLINCFFTTGRLIGIFNEKPADFLKFFQNPTPAIPDEILNLGKERAAAKQEKNFTKADEIRKKIESLGYTIKDLPNNGFEIL